MNLNDVGNFATDYGQSRSASVCDFDGDGDIDTADDAIIDTAYGTTSLLNADPLVSYPRHTSFRLGYHLGVKPQHHCGPRYGGPEPR